MIKRIWTGPKEWRPERPPKLPCLSDAEQKTFSRLQAMVKRGDPANPAELAWLVALAERLATRGPDDYEFQADMGLFNPISKIAYMMHLSNEVPFHQAAKYAGFTEKTCLLETVTISHVTDAILVARPWVRIMPGTAPGAENLLREATLSMEIDGEILLHTPVDLHLILEDGSFPRKHRWKCQTHKCSCLFTGCPLTRDRKNVYSEDPQGIFCCNGTMIRIYLHPKTPYAAETCLKSGLVAARYVASVPGFAEPIRPL